jgi:diguanylate cyclase (GGDEF)-like protein
MARKYKVKSSSGYTVVLADDDPDYLEATRLLLESEGHEVLCARSGPEALDFLRKSRAHLLLLDYFMPGMTGEEVVAALRAFDPLVQVILQTGYASEHPPREMLRRLDIQGYYDKSEGPDRLLLWTDAGLKAAAVVQRLYQSREGLRFVLDVTPSMHKIQPIADLASALLTQLADLLRCQGSPRVAAVEGCVAIVEDDSELVVCAATGPFEVGRTLGESLASEELHELTAAIERGEPVLGAGSTILPLRVGELTVGVIFARVGAVAPLDIELLKVFANQATVAIQNAQLYEMAALDPLTGVYARRFLERWMVREIRAAFRSRHPLSVLILDLDDLKGINDTAGHLAGDQALMAMGKVLRQATRDTDVVARYGGDEFVVILPQTSVEEAETVGRRILEVLQDRTVAGPKEGLSLKSSAGLSVLPAHTFSPEELRHPFPQGYFQGVAQDLIRHADVALYRAKRQGRGRLCSGEPAGWEPPGGEISRS